METRPEGAEIWIGGEKRADESPAEIDGLVSGEEIEVTAKLFGYASSSEKVVPGEEPLDFELRMRPAKFELEIETEPPGAQVTADGKWLAKSPSTVRRKMDSKFEYEIKKVGYEEHTGQLSESDWTEEDGVFKASIAVELEKIEQAAAKQPAAGAAGKKKAAAKAQPEKKPQAEKKPEPKPEKKPEPKPEKKPEPKPEKKPEKKGGSIDDNPFG